MKKQDKPFYNLCNSDHFGARRFLLVQSDLFGSDGILSDIIIQGNTTMLIDLSSFDV